MYIHKGLQPCGPLSFTKETEAISLATEQFLRQYLPVEIKVLCELAEHCAQGPNFQGTVCRDRDVMLGAGCGRSEAHVTTGLPNNAVTITV